MTSVRTLAFGQLDPADVWGAAWIADDAPALAAAGAGRDWTALPGLRSSGGSNSEDWNLDGGGADLVAAAACEPVAVEAPDDGIEGWDQLCRVTGHLHRDGTEHAIDCLGLRTWWSSPHGLERYESVRAVSLWFEPDEAMALTSFRPRKAKAHDRDLLAAALITPDGSAAVEESRLSTTYSEGGWPVRVGVELWLAGEEPDQQYPRRASGEATGAQAEALAERLELRARPFRWHSRGRDGAGMYLLARPR